MCRPYIDNQRGVVSLCHECLKRSRKMKQSSIYEYYCLCTQLFKAVKYCIMNVLFIVRIDKYLNDFA